MPDPRIFWGVGHNGFKQNINNQTITQQGRVKPLREGAHNTPAKASHRPTAKAAHDPPAPTAHGRLTAADSACHGRLTAAAFLAGNDWQGGRAHY